MKQRIRLFIFNELIQATVLKLVNQNQMDCLIITVYGYTKEYDHIQFNYDLEFPDESLRDLMFNDMESELLYEDIVKLIKSSNIPILI